MSGLQEDKYHIKIYSVQFIKIPSAHQKKTKIPKIHDGAELLSREL